MANFFLTAAPGKTPTGVINTAGNSGISNLSLVATGGDYGCWVIALKIHHPGKFRARAVNFYAVDQGRAGNYICGITNGINNTPIDCRLDLMLCLVNLEATGSRASLIGMESAGKGYIATIHFSTILSSGAQSWGISTSLGSTTTLNSCTIIAQDYALIDQDQESLITANQCVIEGSVSSGVIINQ